MTYDEAIAQLQEWSSQLVSKPDNQFTDVLKAVEANHNLMIRRWKNWRSYAQDLWAVCGEGNARGRPIDAMHRDDYRRMLNWQKECHKTDTEVADERLP